MRASYNQKGKGKAKKKRNGPTFQTHLCLWNISLKEPLLVIFSQISSGEQLQRMYSERCIIHSSMLTVGEKQECLLSRGAIYHGKYVRPRPVKG